MGGVLDGVLDSALRYKLEPEKITYSNSIGVNICRVNTINVIIGLTRAIDIRPGSYEIGLRINYRRQGEDVLS